MCVIIVSYLMFVSGGWMVPISYYYLLLQKQEFGYNVIHTDSRHYNHWLKVSNWIFMASWSSRKMIRFKHTGKCLIISCKCMRMCYEVSHDFSQHFIQHSYLGFHEGVSQCLWEICTKTPPFTYKIVLVRIHGVSQKFINMNYVCRRRLRLFCP